MYRRHLSAYDTSGPVFAIGSNAANIEFTNTVQG